jgi:hypothetical protein
MYINMAAVTANNMLQQIVLYKCDQPNSDGLQLIS